MSRIKICGLRTLQDIGYVNRFLPDYAGFVFAPSRRRISPQEAEILKKRLDRRIISVGVFVNQPIELILSLTKSGIIDMVQLHGDENEEYIGALRRGFGGEIIRAVPVANTPPLPYVKADYTLFDTVGASRGGSGKAFDWGLLKNISDPYFLAGGLNPENVREAIRTLKPFCVDVSSGVETGGVKDPEKIEQFIYEARSEL